MWWQVDLSRHGRCWSEDYSFIVQADSQEEASAKVVEELKSHDPATFRIDISRREDVDMSKPIMIQHDYWDG